MELIKEKSLKQGIQQTLQRAENLQRSILFSYSFRFEVRDLLPILTHPADKNKIRVYWEQPSRGLSFAGLGSILEFQHSDKDNFHHINEQIKNILEQGIFVSDNSLVGPRILGGYAFNQYQGNDSTWNKFPRTQFLLPECLGTSTDDGSWLTISRMVQPNEKIEFLLRNRVKFIFH